MNGREGAAPPEEASARGALQRPRGSGATLPVGPTRGSRCVAASGAEEPLPTLPLRPVEIYLPPGPPLRPASVTWAFSVTSSSPSVSPFSTAGMPSTIHTAGGAPWR